MLATVRYGSQQLDFELEESQRVAIWSGPVALAPGEIRRRTLAVLEEPLGYPPLRQAVVPGDRVVIAVSAGLPGLGEIVGAIREVLAGAGVEPEAVSVLATGRAEPGWGSELPAGVELAVHEPEDGANLSYLATTAGGRRIYLNRRVTDADVVVPVGWLGFDPVLGYHGPWAEVFPGLSDRATREALAAEVGRTSKNPARERLELGESTEVSWLLGARLQVAVEVGSEGVSGVHAGEAAALEADARRRIDATWRLRTDRAADIAIAGVGVAWRPTSWANLAAGLRSAARLVRPGGKIAVLTDLGEPPGAAIEALSHLDDPREGAVEALRAHHEEPDYPVALAIAKVLGSHDLYLHSGLNEELVEDLGAIALDRPGQVTRLLAGGRTCVVLSPAERVRTRVVDAED